MTRFQRHFANVLRIPLPMFYLSSPRIWKGVSATLQSGKYTLSYTRGRYVIYPSFWSICSAPLISPTQQISRQEYSIANHQLHNLDCQLYFNQFWNLNRSRGLSVKAGEYHYIHWIRIKCIWATIIVWTLSRWLWWSFGEAYNNGPFKSSRCIKLSLKNPINTTQNFCITFIQSWTNVEDVWPMLHKCYTDVFCLLEMTYFPHLGVLERTFSRHCLNNNVIFSQLSHSFCWRWTDAGPTLKQQGQVKVNVTSVATVTDSMSGIVRLGHKHIAMQRQKAITAHFSSKQLLPFGFAVPHTSSRIVFARQLHTHSLVRLYNPLENQDLYSIKTDFSSNDTPKIKVIHKRQIDWPHMLYRSAVVVWRTARKS